MERMLVVVFENETKAYEGSRALMELDSEGNISIHAQAVIRKNDDGTVTTKQIIDDFPIHAVEGTAIGALIGLLGGPVGVAFGAVGGTIAGSIWGINVAGVDAEFLNDVSAKLTAGKWAVVSNISEEWVTPLDTQMEELGGTVFRITRYSVENEQDAREVAALKADIAQLKTEQAKSHGEHKAKLQAKIDNLQKKLRAKLEQAKQRSEQVEKETQAKVDALKKRAAKAKGEAKAVTEERIEELRKRMKKSKEEFRELREN